MKISFIIPAYNVENFIGKCLDSILHQPCGDFEVIIINDGSTDNTAQVIESYSRQDSRIRVFSQANAGQGAARSFGLTQAQGDYVWFVDSDDWLIDSVLPRIGQLLNKYKPDVLVVNFEFTFDHQSSVPSSLVPPHLVGEIIEPKNDVGNFSAVSCWNTPPWRLISRRQHLIDEGIRFATGVFYEDHPFAIHLMLTAKSVYVDGCVSYGYYQRSSSTTKVNDRKAFDFLEVRRQCLALFSQFGVYESFSPIVAGYIAPANFYKAHVAEPFRSEFINRLADELSDEEFSYVQKYGDWATRQFAEAVQARDPGLIERRERTERLRSRYSKDGAKRFAVRIKGMLIRRILHLLMRIKSVVVRQSHHSGVDTTGMRFLKAGPGTRIEATCIDVRIKQESRPYVVVGNYSHVGGTFVFERGLGTITIGNKSSIGGGSKIICTQEGGIQIGDNVMLAWGCTLMDSDAHSLNPEIRANDAYDWKCGVDAGRIGAFKDWSQVRSAPIIIENNAWLGFESAVLKGVRIGRGSVIGARSVVTRDISPFGIYAGNPAKFVRFVPREQWSWEEIIEASQGNPDMQEMLKDAYLHADLSSSLKNFRKSGECLETLAEIRRYAPLAKRILDIGGGAGVMSIALALEGYEVTLVEPSSSSIVGVAGASWLLDWASEEFDSSIRDRVKIIQSNVENFDTEDRYDIAYCRQVVHHFADPRVALSKIRTFLQPDAIVFLVREHVVFDDDDLQVFFESHPFHRYTNGENAYRAEEYCSFIADAGFQLLRKYGFAETLINCHPHDPEYCRSIEERSIAGRPYSFLARNTGASS